MIALLIAYLVVTRVSSLTLPRRRLDMSLKVGIVGATGAVGRELLGVLESREFPCAAPVLFGSKGGKSLSTKWGELTTQPFSIEATEGLDVVFLAASGDFARENARKIPCLVVDNSSALRLEKDVPLIVPEVNGHLCKDAKTIANPNCTTAIAIMALYPLFKKFGLKKVIVSTYQAASGAGAAGMDELRQTMSVADSHIDAKGIFNQDTAHEVFAHSLPFNVIPHIDTFQDNDYTKEEMKVVWETKKLLGFELDAGPKISCTAVRIPTLRAHSEAITIETEKPCTVEEAQAVLREAPGIQVEDAPQDLKYPMPLTATGAYDVEVGRIRQSLVFENYGLDLFVCGDQLLRGAALNAVLIAEQALL